MVAVCGCGDVLDRVAFKDYVIFFLALADEPWEVYGWVDAYGGEARGVVGFGVELVEWDILELGWLAALQCGGLARAYVWHDIFIPGVFAS